ncbi:NLR family CARD domain-containing protein 3-like [Stylophora pistillata]|uniref:NLR family CARD domain-containing protein 3-like n=1 Tax=Stylophora pistillata TaxID=50429 RepID=UPI000C048A6E|nr:NLR family CARD domain-containing protein 3-like [Stylophora pistillata]
MKSMAAQLNQEDRNREARNSMTVILECIYECKNENYFDVKLARTLGPCLQIETITVRRTLRSEVAKTILLTNILRTNTSMTKLDLSLNKICDDGAAALADCLKEKKSLTDLSLSSNEIGDAGAAALAKCLKENKCLRTLDLDENNISEAGAAALAECVKENSSLEKLYLNGNILREAGAAALAK